MRKYIIINDEDVKAAKGGKCVEGSLRWDEELRCMVFRAYRRSCRRKRTNRLLYESQNGWLGESAERLKMHISVKKRAGKTRCALTMLRESNEMATLLYRMGVEEGEEAYV